MTVYISEPEMLVRFVDGLKVAAGSAHQLAHAQENPNWLSIRDKLETLIEMGQKMAMAKSMPRQQVLAELDKRQKRHFSDLNTKETIN
jgi:uncharacterized membrane protein YfbV (UPF0208 family)